MITTLPCPLCSTPLLHAVRIRPNVHVLYCPAMNTHGYIEGTGDNQDEAMKDIKAKAKGRQKELL